MLIGLMGFPAVGKNTVANLFHQTYGFQVLEFKEPMKRAMYATDPWVYIHRTCQFSRYKLLVDAYGYDWVKANTDVRPMMQDMVSEWENIWGKNVLVDILEPHLEGFDSVITDVRTPAQVDMVAAHGGYLVEVTMRGKTAPNEHPADNLPNLIQAPYQIVNEPGDLEGLATRVTNLYEELRSENP